MKKKILIALLIILLVGAAFIIGRQVGLNTEDDKTQTIITEEIVSKHDIQKTLAGSGQVSAKTTEKLELTTTKYFEAMCVEEDETVLEGENILKYTNGTYLQAPYDCYITSLNLPELEGKVLNSHYVEISSSNSLMVTMNIDETNIENISIGLEATIEITSLNKTYKGNITHIASTGNNGKFEIEIEFENDGDVKLGMTADVSVTI